MIINCDKPDLLLVYIGGGAGRAIIHQLMLSPELHSWSPDLEMILDAHNETEHASIKLDYFKQHVFPTRLQSKLSAWKKYEAEPWNLKIEKTKTVIRHAWVRETAEFVFQFGAKKVSFVDYTNCYYFVLRAAVEKKAGMIVSLPANKELGKWLENTTKYEAQEILVEQLHQAEAALARWKGYHMQYGFHPISLERWYFTTVDEFVAEYSQLCNFYNITPVIDQSIDLRTHWLDLQWSHYPNTTLSLT